MPRMTCTPGTEVIGRVMVPYLGSLPAEVVAPLVIKHKLMDISPEQWYPLQPWLGFINELSTQPDFSSNMITVGLKVTQMITSTPRMVNLTLPQILEDWDANFRANYRNGEVGHITVEKVNFKFYKTIHQHIYPDDFNYGMVYGFARAKLRMGTHFTVWYEDNERRLDRGGGDRTVICVQWG